MKLTGMLCAFFIAVPITMSAWRHHPYEKGWHDPPAPSLGMASELWSEEYTSRESVLADSSKQDAALVIPAVVVSERVQSLRSPLSQKLVRVPVQPGQSVNAGDEIFQLDDSLVCLEIARQRELESSLSARIQEAEANLELASDAHQRMMRLRESRVVTDGDLIRHRTELAAAKARLASVSADAAAAARERERLERHLTNFVGRAVIDGTVTEVHCHAGEWVAEGDWIVCVESSLVLKTLMPADSARSMNGYSCSIEKDGQSYLLDAGRIDPRASPTGELFVVFDLPPGVLLVPYESVQLRLVTTKRESVFP